MFGESLHQGQCQEQGGSGHGHVTLVHDDEILGVHWQLLQAAGPVQGSLQAGAGGGIPHCGGFHGQV